MRTLDQLTWRFYFDERSTKSFLEVLWVVTGHKFNLSKTTFHVVPSACAKSGVEALTKSLAAEWGRKGIRLNAIAPGPIYTDGAFGRLDPDGSEISNMLEKVPCGRLGEREELANLASFMCSDYASWLSGEIINFDGGNIRQLAGMFDKVRKVPEGDWDRIEAKIKGLKSNKK